MPKSRSRPRAAAKAAAQRRLRQGHQDPDEAAWQMAGRAARLAIVRPEDWPPFAAAPWDIWLAAHAAGAPPGLLAQLAHQWFWFRHMDISETTEARTPDEWLTEPMTLAELIAGAMPETIISSSRDESTADLIGCLTSEGVLSWDQESQTATTGPRTVAEELADDEAHFAKFGHY